MIHQGEEPTNPPQYEHVRQPAEGSVSERRTDLWRSSRCQGVPADPRRAQAPEGARADVELKAVTVSWR